MGRQGRSARLLAGLGVSALGVLLFFLFLPGPEGPRPEPRASIKAPKPTTVAPTSSPSLPSRAARTKADPFVAPLGTPPLETQAPAADATYTIQARLDGDDLRVRTSAAVSLYVFAIDDADQPLLVFPIPGRRPENPLVPGQETRLWVGAAPSHSRLVAVASPARIVGLEAEMGRQRVPLASWWGTLPLTQPALAHLGSALGFAPRDAGRFLAGAQPHTGHVEMTRGVWIRRVER